MNIIYLIKVLAVINFTILIYSADSVAAVGQDLQSFSSDFKVLDEDKSAMITEIDTPVKVAEQIQNALVPMGAPNQSVGSLGLRDRLSGAFSGIKSGVKKVFGESSCRANPNSTLCRIKFSLSKALKSGLSKVGIPYEDLDKMMTCLLPSQERIETFLKTAAKSPFSRTALTELGSDPCIEVIQKADKLCMHPAFILAQGTPYVGDSIKAVCGAVAWVNSSLENALSQLTMFQQKPLIQYTQQVKDAIESGAPLPPLPEMKPTAVPQAKELPASSTDQNIGSSTDFDRQTPEEYPSESKPDDTPAAVISSEDVHLTPDGQDHESALPIPADNPPLPTAVHLETDGQDHESGTPEAEGMPSDASQEQLKQLTNSPVHGDNDLANEQKNFLRNNNDGQPIVDNPS